MIHMLGSDELISFKFSFLCILSFRYCLLLHWLVTPITRTPSMHVWITDQKPISDQFPVRTIATWNHMRPRGSLQVGGINFKGPYFWFCRMFLHFFFKFSLDSINNSDSSSRSFRINGTFVSLQLNSRMWKVSSLLCCQYITVGSQPYRTPLRRCLFSISSPSLLLPLSHIL